MRPSASLSLIPLLYAGVEAQSLAGNASFPASAGSSSQSIVANASSTATAPTAATSGLVNTGENPLIPTSVSSGCQLALELINGDTTLAACTEPVLSALALFTSDEATYSGTPETVSATLDSLCATTACSSTQMRSTLATLEAGCSAELASYNTVVLAVYDALYTVTPFLQAVCSQDSEGGYCLSDIVSGNFPTASVASNSTADNSTVISNTTSLAKADATFTIQAFAGSAATLPQSLYTHITSATARFFKRQAVTNSSTEAAANTTDATTTASPTTLDLTSIVPAASTFAENDVNFLFLSPNMSSSILCTACTKSIFTSYVSWEMRKPYSPGLVNSPTLKRQGTVWAGIGNVCGSGFLQSIAVAAGQSTDLAGAASTVPASVGGVAIAFVLATFALMV